MTTKAENYQQLFHQYQQEHGDVPETPYRVVQWALKKGLLEAPKIDPAAVLASEMSKALREEYCTDPKSGRRYRRNHAVRITSNSLQYALWADIEDAPRSHMVKAFQQRRQQVVGDCYQLKTDVTVYNSKHPENAEIQLVLDFTHDVAELEASEDAAAE